MRLKNIHKIKETICNDIQILQSTDISCFIQEPAHVQYKQLKHSLKRFIATPFLMMQQANFHNQLKCEVPFRYDLLCLGERFSSEAPLNELLKLTRSAHLNRVLMVGCSYGGEEVNFWLRTKIKKFVGIELYNFNQHWQKTLPDLRSYYNCEIDLLQATVESMPLENESFDLITSNAVLEHVKNLDLAVQEMARVLSKEGWALHVFGPLYFSYGGDHCISAYGNDRGYDHLLMDEEKYRLLIHDQTFFDTTNDSFANHWAKTDQFSFLVANEYINSFSKYFHIEHVLVKISDSGIAFRNNYPNQWKSLIDAGIPEIDLLVDSLAVILRKKY